HTTPPAVGPPERRHPEVDALAKPGLSPIVSPAHRSNFSRRTTIGTRRSSHRHASMASKPKAKACPKIAESSQVPLDRKIIMPRLAQARSKWSRIARLQDRDDAIRTRPPLVVKYR